MAKLIRDVSSIRQELEGDLDRYFRRLPERDSGNEDSVKIHSIVDETPLAEYLKMAPLVNVPYELDAFQKRAMMVIEKDGNVLVCAHTGSGKSNIGLAAVMRCLFTDRSCIWTNPIKALSNQVYRKVRRYLHSQFSEEDEEAAPYEDISRYLSYDDDDDEYFRYEEEEQWAQESPGSVEARDEKIGLVTGDVRLNEKAPVLVMTPEILRNMLLRGDRLDGVGSVVMDEAHFANDADRGYVYEQLPALLPKHVSMVFLSATVGNARRFADWVGSVRGKPTYILKTPHRPIPLNFSIFTGTNFSDSDVARRAILNKDAGDTVFVPVWRSHGMEFDRKMVAAAKQHLRRSAKLKYMSPAQLKGRLLSLVQALRKEDKLPAIIFILSRNRIMTHARQLSGLDLLPEKRKKSAVVRFFREVKNRIPIRDQEGLEQLKFCEELALRGIGLHHSGLITPIKEAYELLMQSDGLLKLLLSTETVACGIDTPTRTVVFLDLTKPAGQGEFRALRTSEALQMAGRAGRRGHDTEGNVVICTFRDNFPNLEVMFTGKPEPIQSRFSLDDATILSLLIRSSTLDIEQLMRSSFQESVDWTRRALKLRTRIKTFLEGRKSEAENASRSKDQYKEVDAHIRQVRSFRQLPVPEKLWGQLFRQSMKRGSKVLVLPPWLQGNGPSTVMDRLMLIPFKVKKLEKEGFESESGERIAYRYSIGIIGQGGKCIKLKTTKFRLSYDQQMQLKKHSSAVDELVKMEKNLDWSNVLSSVALQVEEAIYFEDAVKQLESDCSPDALLLMPRYRERCTTLEKYGFLKQESPYNYVVTKLGYAGAGVTACQSAVILTWLTGAHAPKSPDALAGLLSCFIYDRKSKRTDKLLVEGIVELRSVFESLRPEYADWPEPSTGILNATVLWARGHPLPKAMEQTDELPGTFVKCILRLCDLLRQLSDVAINLGTEEIQVLVENAWTALHRDIVVCPSMYVQ